MADSNLVIQRNIKRFRKYYHMTQEELGLASGLSCAYISKIERNAANITVKTLDSVAQGLKVPTVHLFDENLCDSKIESIFTLQDYFVSISKLPPERQNEVMLMLKIYFGVQRNL